MNINQFIYPHQRYFNHAKPEEQAFHTKLQKFSQRVSYICALESSGKISPTQAYININYLWQELRQAKKQLLGE